MNDSVAVRQKMWYSGSGAIAISAPSLKLAEDRVDPGVHQVAVVYGDKSVAIAVDEAQLPLAIDRKPGMIAVVPGLDGGQRCQQRRLGEVAFERHLPRHSLLFKDELKGVIDMLPLAAGAPAHVLAAWRDTIG